MPNFRARREKLRKTNVKPKFPIFYFFNLIFKNLNVGLHYPEWGFADFFSALSRTHRHGRHRPTALWQAGAH